MLKCKTGEVMIINLDSKSTKINIKKCPGHTDKLTWILSIHCGQFWRKEWETNISEAIGRCSYRLYLTDYSKSWVQFTETTHTGQMYIWIFQSTKKILPLFTHLHVVSNLYDFPSSVRHHERTVFFIQLKSMGSKTTFTISKYVMLYSKDDRK